MTLSAAAVDALCELGAIDTLLSNFIKPLQGSEIATVDSNGNLDRIHCSLNINTETGRLSARRPNLQNQPALEKDRYKVSSHTSWSNTCFALLKAHCRLREAAQHWKGVVGACLNSSCFQLLNCLF